MLRRLVRRLRWFSLPEIAELAIWLAEEAARTIA
jgi:hypothetical protein